MTRRILSSVVFGWALCLSGCEPQGACEAHQTFTEVNETHYRCSDDYSLAICDSDYSDVNFAGQPYSVVDTFHPRLSCAEVGYPYTCGYDELSNADCDPTKGPSSGSGSGGGGCGGDYGGPYFQDVQVDSQCQWIYYNSCTQEAINAGCANIDAILADGVANVCPYC